MKKISLLPIEYKPDPSTRNKVEGRYLIPHPLIKKYFFEVEVQASVIQENISIKLVCLISVNKAIFRSVPRFCTWDDCQMIRDSFWEQDDAVMQIQGVNFEEMKAGNYYSHLYHMLPVK